MSPKSLLRHKTAISSLEDLCDGEFQNAIADDGGSKPEDITRMILCAGKVYYDLESKRAEDELSNVAIVRIEQLYPFPEEQMLEIVGQYKNLASAVWCQEEPMNQGAWYSSQHHMRRVVNKIFPGLNLQYAGREASAAAAAGYMSLHLQQMEAFVHAALYGENN
jgi:2-oxoglutarate dehydrogenase E1 component